MVKLSHIKKFYRNNPDVPILNDINLDIPKGAIFGIMGKSGAGKSTLLRTINLLEKPSSGEVIFDGVKLTSLKELDLRKERQKMGMIFQHFNLLSQATVFKNIALPLIATGTSKHECEKRVSYLLKVVGLEDKHLSYPKHLSGGQKQRVAIARALALNPKLLLCDEATSALDSETIQSILDLLLDINKNFGITIVFISHQEELIKKICTHVIEIEEGKIC